MDAPIFQMIRHGITCTECGRTFDLLNPADADEWTYGHDCEDLGDEQ